MSISAIVMLIVAILIIWGGLGLAMLNLHRHPDLDALDESAEALSSELYNVAIYSYAPPADSWWGITAFYADVRRAERANSRALLVLRARGLILLL